MIRTTTTIFLLVASVVLQASPQLPPKGEKQIDDKCSEKAKEENLGQQKAEKAKSSFGSAIFPFFFYPVLTDSKN